MSERVIRLPHNYTPRWYQLPFLKAFDSELYNRFVLVWHRRSGKDLTCLSLAVREAIITPQIITYVFPTLKMGREVLWEGMDNEGHKFIDHYIPQEIVAGKPNDTRMTIDFRNGSIFRVGGSDNPDSLRGGNTKLFILSEWAEQDPYTWAVIRPIVLANNGKVVFNFTPKGDNHGRTTYDLAGREKGWWRAKLTVKDTHLFSEDQLRQELREMIAEHGEVEGQARYDQEYMCSFEAPVVGSYFGEHIQRAEAEGRVANVPYDTSLPVNTVWDLGVGDANAIWFYQTIGKEIRIIDFYASSSAGIEHYADKLKEKGYVYGEHFAPHDIEIKEYATGKTRLEVARNFGINFKIVPKLSREDGIQAARNLISRCWFDKEKCEQGLSALKNYRREWDEKNKVYRPYPKHDWASHPADAFRYLAVSYNEPLAQAAVFFSNKRHSIAKTYYVGRS